jgi:glycosyltransferase involved in cell wall biosynthesis
LNTGPGILILGIGRNIPVFIRRRINKLAEERFPLILFTSLNDELRLGESVSIVRKVDNPLSEPWTYLRMFFFWLVRFPLNVRLWRVSQGTYWGRLKWCVNNASLFISRKKIRLIHAQWLPDTMTLRWIREFFPGIPLMVSVRGSQVTVHAKEDVKAREVLKLNLDTADCIHCVSKDLARICLSLGAEPSKVYVNYNGVDLSTFKPRDRKVRKSGEFHIVSVGGLMWRKGYVFHLAILRELIRRGVNVSMTIVGEGPDYIGLKYTAFRLGVEPFVEFVGAKKANEVVLALQDADLYLSCSAAEGLPNSLVEAAACGLPIVSFDCEGVREIVDEQLTGYVVPFGDVESAVKRIVQLEADPAQLHEMGLAARRKMEREFDEKYWVEDMIGQYNRLSAPV